MPTYDYECEKCGNRFEVFQSMSADRLTDCEDENCDGKVKRLIGTGAGLIFKGSGFYETDYRSDSYKAGAKKDGGDSGSKKSEGGSKSGDSGSKKSESKSSGSSTTKSGGSSSKD